jgi:hypothetical protein
MAKNKQIETLLAQYYTLCSSCSSPTLSPIDAEHKIDDVQKELATMLDIDKECHDPKKKYLYKVLFSTKALDTALKTFLEIHSAWPCGTNPPSLGGYINALKRGGHPFNTLAPHIARAANKKIVDKRNEYLHSANKYPTRQEQENICDKILEFMQTVVNLA